MAYIKDISEVVCVPFSSSFILFFYLKIKHRHKYAPFHWESESNVHLNLINWTQLKSLFPKSNWTLKFVNDRLVVCYIKWLQIKCYIVSRRRFVYVLVDTWIWDFQIVFMLNFLWAYIRFLIPGLNKKTLVRIQVVLSTTSSHAVMCFTYFTCNLIQNNCCLEPCDVFGFCLG